MTWLSTHNLLEKITSFSLWMEAWNVYLAILIDHSPAQAPQLVVYQRIITSASAQYPLATWLNYDTQFRTSAVSDPTLCWDTWPLHRLVATMCYSPSSTIRWPCSHCGDGPRYLFRSLCCTTRHIFEPLHVYEPDLNMDKYVTCFSNFVFTVRISDLAKTRPVPMPLNNPKPFVYSPSQVFFSML